MNAIELKFIIELLVVVFALVVGNGLMRYLKKVAIDYDFHKQWLWVIGVIILNFMILFEGMAFKACDMVLYQPHINIKAHRNMEHMADIEKIELATPVGICTGWMYHAKQNPNNSTIIIFAGRSETSAEMMSVEGAFSNPSLGNVIICDYPGYGQSQGIPTERNLKKMMLSAFDQLVQRDDIKDQNIIVWGYSLGTGIANYVCSQRDVDGLILMAPYLNGYELMNHFVDVFYGVFKIGMPYKMRSDKFAEKINVAPIIFASTDDDMIEYKSSQALSEKYKMGSDFHTYNNLGHGGFWSSEDVWKNIYEYIGKCASNSGK